MAAKGTLTPAAEAFLDRKIINAKEDYHSRLESGVAPIIEHIRRGDLSFYDDDGKCITFLHFLCVQMLRTKGLLERMRRCVQEPLHGCSDAATPDLVSSSSVLCHIFAANVGASFYRERKQRRLVLLTNQTTVPFVTGDQPVINLLGTRQAGSEPKFTTRTIRSVPDWRCSCRSPGLPCSYSAGPLSASRSTNYRRNLRRISSAGFRQHGRSAPLVDSCERERGIADTLRALPSSETLFRTPSR